MTNVKKRKNRFIFVVGGAKSGKTAFACATTESLSPERTYVATAEALDAEMKERIAKHKCERKEGWSTVEEPLNVAATIEGIASGAALKDCLTLWITNLVMDDAADVTIFKEAETLARACRAARADVVVVSNEVGLGVVPTTVAGRRFLGLSGTVNQTMAAGADEVYFIVSGMPIKVK